MGPCKILSKLDMSQGFHQIEVDQGSRDYTTFVTQYGHYRYQRMPFGLKNAPAVFQQLMDEVLSSCRDCASTYMDDVLVLVLFSRLGGTQETLGQSFSNIRKCRDPGKCQSRISGPCNRMWVFGYSRT